MLPYKQSKEQKFILPRKGTKYEKKNRADIKK